MNELITILKGGPGSGDWGHTGRAGKRGGSGGGGGKGKSRRGRRSREVLDKEIEAGEEKEKTTQEKGRRSRSDGSEDEKMITVYHGTTINAVHSILETGLHVTPASATDQTPSIAEGVYFTKKKQTAQEYGMMMSETGENFAIVKINMPNREKSRIHEDLYDKKWYDATDSFYYEKSIPPKWIESVDTFEWEEGKGFVIVDTATKQDTGILYSVVMIQPRKAVTTLKSICRLLHTGKEKLK